MILDFVSFTFLLCFFFVNLVLNFTSCYVKLKESFKISLFCSFSVVNSPENSQGKSDILMNKRRDIREMVSTY